jgi:hypothetical protein
MTREELEALPVLETCGCGWSTRVAKYDLAWHKEVHKCRWGEQLPRRRGNLAPREKYVRQKYCEFALD